MSVIASSDSQENDIRLNALIAIQLRLAHRLAGEDPKKEIGSDAIFLRKFGFKNFDIALILGSTPGSVAALISQNAANGKPRAKARKR